LRLSRRNRKNQSISNEKANAIKAELESHGKKKPRFHARRINDHHGSFGDHHCLAMILSMLKFRAIMDETHDVISACTRQVPRKSSCFSGKARFAFPQYLDEDEDESILIFLPIVPVLSHRTTI
jgi:hypothetical protein